MILYADTSALAKLLLREEGTQDMQDAFSGADLVASASIAYVELRAALAAARRDGRLSKTSREHVRQAVDDLWAGVSEVLLEPGLVRRAGDLAEEQRLRGYDAVHLAALESLGAPETVIIACWDEDLGQAARRLGYRVLGS